MTKIAVMQPYFFPYVGYWQLIKAVDAFVILDDVNYINRGWINRNNILLNSQPHMITLSLSGASQNRKINEIEILPDDAAHRKILKTIRAAYSKLPGADAILEFVARVVNYRGFLAEALRLSLLEVSRFLGIQTPILTSSGLVAGHGLKSHEKIIAIVKALGGDTYVNPPGGRNLYSHGMFERNGLALKFIKPGFTPYPQRSDSFVPGLSIIDCLMNAGASREIIDNYTLGD